MLESEMGIFSVASAVLVVEGGMMVKAGLDVGTDFFNARGPTTTGRTAGLAVEAPGSAPMTLPLM